MSFINNLMDRAQRRYGDRMQQYGLPLNQGGHQSPYQLPQQPSYSPLVQSPLSGRYDMPTSPYGYPQQYGQPHPYGQNSQINQPAQPPPYDQTHQQEQPQVTQPNPSSTTIMDPEGCLATHNLTRAQKNLPPLQWSPNLARSAQAWANQLARTNSMQHASQRGQGENLAMKYGSPDVSMSFAEATQGWLGEESLYHGEAIGQGDLHAWGHYTQCMWGRTTHVGMAKAKSSSGAVFVVARYWPQGNLRGERPY